jgi:aconitate hydratase
VSRAVRYIDHNVIQPDHKNPDDHRFLQALCRRYGASFSRAGNGISHYISLERFARPGDVLLGADSYTTTSGALGMIAIGAGGLDVAPAERCAFREYGEAPERS